MEAARAAANSAEATIADAKRQTAAALRSRDRAESMLLAVVEVHIEAPDKRCSCGQPYPCVTVRAMGEHDDGYAHRLIREQGSPE
jgi:hypothetical protein